MLGTVKPAGPTMEEQRTYTERYEGGVVRFFTLMVRAPVMVWLFSTSVTVLILQLRLVFATISM